MTFDSAADAKTKVDALFMEKFHVLPEELRFGLTPAPKRRLGLLDKIRSWFAWRTYDETWAWCHQCNMVTGQTRDIQKRRGVPMAPPPRPAGSPPPPSPKGR